MNITYDWEILDMSVIPDADPEQDVIQRVMWMRKATDGKYTAATCRDRGIIQFDPVSHEDFRPFRDFTQEIMSGWLDQHIPETVRREMDAELAELIADNYRPRLIKNTLPWSETA